MDKYTVRNATGSVDINASISAYTQALSSWVAANETNQEIISNAVDSVFEKYQGQNVPMQALVSNAAMNISSDPNEFKMLSERVHTFVKGLVSQGSLKVNKGKGGGVSKV